MLVHYPAQGRGYTNLDWLQSYHSFSFGEFYDPERMGISALRVLNDDVVQPGKGFGAHPHRDMEIITYVISGTIEHQDSLGHKELIRAGECQRMTAGTGIVHSEYNPSANEPLRLLQIWIRPAQVGLKPSYQQMAVTEQPGLTWLASGDHQPGTLHLHQDARLAHIGSGDVQVPLAAERAGFLYVIEGEYTIAGRTFTAGDGLELTQETDPRISGSTGARALWLDLPGYRL